MTMTTLPKQKVEPGPKGVAFVNRVRKRRNVKKPVKASKRRNRK